MLAGRVFSLEFCIRLIVRYVRGRDGRWWLRIVLDGFYIRGLVGGWVSLRCEGILTRG